MPRGNDKQKNTNSIFDKFHNNISDSKIGNPTKTSPMIVNMQSNINFTYFI